MKPAAPPIGVAEDARGIVVSLPPRFWLLVSLRKLFRRMLPEPMAWTYRLPRTIGAAKRVEVWISEVELQVRAEERRRAWTASDAEWHDTPQPTPAAPIAAEPVVVTLPTEETGPSVLDLLRRLNEGATMVATIEEDGVRRYRLEPRGYLVRTTVAERAIRERLVAPGNDGLLGPDFSQTWRAPTREEVTRAEPRPTKAKGKTKAPTKRRAPPGGALHHPSTITRSV
ncbi:hypothetical protein ABID82_005244 [Methylobacterium sp. PvP062]|uniref:Uncharacterized protein n=1 Tax=Methylobacterium radiotolerans TaxID=31998 RepID=A0ABV2NQJ1_9HYPH|nr:MULTISPECIES: hypothetical protein [unclassified Methylobacterium]MBP2494631.1 hypothetical protein [Methylobacterium sp. PvP105]MBP2505498.1 hypothetical protein [Methylobacterium sp. PvP109]MCX7330104.1 hypothetical protein [Hyphomicrobiales bacterium]